MRMTAALFTLQSFRLRRVLDHIGAHLEEDLTPADLAEIACLSVSQLERLYRRKVGESPILTLRRLRLERARQVLREENRLVTDVAQAAGYASAAAFNHAFVRLFGHAPSQTKLVGVRKRNLPSLYLEDLPERPVFQVAYAGSVDERGRQTASLSGELAVAGARHWRNWTCLDFHDPLGVRQKIDVIDFVPALRQPAEVRNVDRAIHPGGLYAVWHTWGFPRSGQLPGVIERVRQDLGCVLREDQRMVLRDITVSGYTAPQERRYAVYLPVCRIQRRGLRAAAHGLAVRA